MADILSSVTSKDLSTYQRYLATVTATSAALISIRVSLVANKKKKRCPDLVGCDKAIVKARSLLVVFEYTEKMLTTPVNLKLITQRQLTHTYTLILIF